MTQPQLPFPPTVQMTSAVELITPQLAREYLKYNTHNRPVSKKALARYTEDMRNGNWLLNGEGITFSVDGTLVDGQHRLMAVIESGCSVYMLVTRNAHPDSYKVTDCGLKRTNSDNLATEGVKNSSNAASGIRQCIGFRRGFLSNVGFDVHSPEILEFYRTYSAIVDEITTFGKSCNRSLRLINTSVVIGTCLYLILDKGYDSSFVKAFFNELLVADIPTNKMLAAYRKRLTNDRNAGVESRRKNGMQLLIKIWNAYADGRQLATIKWSEDRDGVKSFK